ncbi:MAG: hypothetical protein ABSG31_13505 [Tepidisphaeraceae bacterium]|jgi:hypothetical protein
MQAEKRRAQIGLVAAVLVLAVSLGVLLKQGSSGFSGGQGPTASPATISPNSISSPMSLTDATHSPSSPAQP